MATCRQPTSTFSAQAGNPWDIRNGWTAGAATRAIETKRYVGLDATDDNGVLHEVLHDCENNCDAVGKTHTLGSGLAGRVKDSAPIHAQTRACCVPRSPPNPCLPPFICVEVRNEAECNAIGGGYHPDDSCTPHPCGGTSGPCIYPPPDCPDGWTEETVWPCHLYDSECNRSVTQWVVNFSGMSACFNPGQPPLQYQARACYVTFWNGGTHCLGCSDRFGAFSRTWHVDAFTGACPFQYGESLASLTIQRTFTGPGGAAEYTTLLVVNLAGTQNFPGGNLFQSFGEPSLFRKSSCPSVNQILSNGWPNEYISCGGVRGAEGGFATIELPRFL